MYSDKTYVAKTDHTLVYAFSLTTFGFDSVDYTSGSVILNEYNPHGRSCFLNFTLHLTVNVLFTYYVLVLK